MIRSTYLRFFSASIALVGSAAIVVSCTSNEAARQNPSGPPLSPTIPKPIAPTKLIKSDYAKGEVAALCQAAAERAEARLTEIANVPAANRTFDNTVLALEFALAELNDETGPLTFMGYVSTNEIISAEGSACEEKLGQFFVDIFTRRGLYDALKEQKGRTKDEERLIAKTLEGFEQNGLKLPDAQLAKVKALMAELSQKETKFSANLNSDKSSVAFTAAELQGAPPDFLARLQKDAAGKFIVTTKSTDYVTVMENVVNGETRRAMQLAYLNRGVAAGNTKLLEEAVALRAQIAQLLGFPTWADYKTSTRMAKSKENVLSFLGSLKQKLSARNQSDLNQLLVFKKELDPAAKSVEQWDLTYLSYQLQKRDFALDNERIREYFPADTVIAGMFKVYSEMLGVTYRQVSDAKVWADGVKLYEIREKTDDSLIAYFYADFIPRAGKYGHAAAFSLISGRRLENGAYSLPVSSIVANFTPPGTDRPSLLTHDEVETVFHEFGHIMHQTLTRAPYASLSGSGVARDFVEAPSQMLENWVWSPQVLSSLSGHYQDPSRKLPRDMLEKLIAAENFQQGYAYTKQLLYGLFDISLHTSASGQVDSTRVFEDLYREILRQEPIPGGHFPAGFGHLMGGYDSGYYGYLWSEVYAQDMFSVFPASSLTNAEVGLRYRRTVLERGNMQDSIELLREFLGREPNNDAFFKKLRI